MVWGGVGCGVGLGCGVGWGCGVVWGGVGVWCGVCECPALSSTLNTTTEMPLSKTLNSRLLRVCVHTSRHFHFHNDKCTLRNITLSSAVFLSVLLSIYVTCAGKMSLNAPGQVMSYRQNK